MGVKKKIRKDKKILATLRKTRQYVEKNRQQAVCFAIHKNMCIVRGANGRVLMAEIPDGFYVLREKILEIKRRFNNHCLVSSRDIEFCRSPEASCYFKGFWYSHFIFGDDCK